jgi:hypothetical protein
MQHPKDPTNQNTVSDMPVTESWGEEHVCCFTLDLSIQKQRLVTCAKGPLVSLLGYGDYVSRRLGKREQRKWVGLGTQERARAKERWKATPGRKKHQRLIDIASSNLFAPCIIVCPRAWSYASTVVCQLIDLSDCRNVCMFGCLCCFVMLYGCMTVCCVCGCLSVCYM